MIFKIVSALISGLIILTLNSCASCGDAVSTVSPEENEIVTSILTTSSNVSFDQDCSCQLSYQLLVSTYTILSNSPNHGDLVMGIIKVFKENDRNLQTKINESLISSSTEWIKGKILNCDSVYTAICYLSNRYLSIENHFSFYSGERYEAIYDYITIDMLNGKRVFLNDFVDVNDQFIALLKQGDAVLASENSEQFDGNVENLRKWLSNMPINELQNRLDDCSKNQQTIIDEGYFSIDESIGSLLFRDNFYIEHGKLILVFGDWDKRVTLDIDGIEPFLKVGKW